MNLETNMEINDTTRDTDVMEQELSKIASDHEQARDAVESEIVQLRDHTQEEEALVETLTEIRQKREEELEYLTRYLEKLVANRRQNIQVSADRVERLDDLNTKLNEEHESAEGRFESGQRAQFMMSTPNLAAARYSDREVPVERMTALEKVCFD